MNISTGFGKAGLVDPLEYSEGGCSGVAFLPMQFTLCLACGYLLCFILRVQIILQSSSLHWIY